MLQDHAPDLFPVPSCPDGRRAWCQVSGTAAAGNKNEKLAGKATVTPVYGEAPVVSMDADAVKTITLDCGGVKIGTTEESATAFWIVVPPD